MIEIKLLNLENVDDFVLFEIECRELEPEMGLSAIDYTSFKEETINRLLSDNFKFKVVLLAYSKNKVVGRLEYHIYGCFMDGYKVCYVDWVCTSILHRHLGVAQEMFRFLKQQMKDQQVNEIRLIRARNEDAKKFYDSFQDSETIQEELLKIYLN